MTKKISEPLFLPAPFYMLRAPVLPMETLELICRDDELTERLFTLFDQDHCIREAILLASPELYKAIQERALKNEKQQKEISASLLKYILRMAARSTPFGLFSFVGLGKWGERSQGSFDHQKLQKRARPDMGWVSKVIDLICENQDLRYNIPIRKNPLVTYCYGRVQLNYFQKKNSNEKEKTAVSIQNSEFIQAILRIADSSLSIVQLEEKLMEEFLSLDRIKARAVIEQLIAQEVLQFALMPSLLTESSYSDFLAKLGNTQLEPREYPLLHDLHKELDKYNKTSFVDTEKDLQHLSSRAQQVVSSEHSLQVDLAAPEGQFTLPEKIGADLSETAEMLWKLSSVMNDNKPSVLKDYHNKFIEKYGFARRIPLLELLGPQELGIPEPYLDTKTASQTSSPEASPWEEWLREQWCLCVHEQRQEITLTKQDMQQFLGDKKDLAKVPLSFSLFCEVIATSTESIDRGEYELYLTGNTWDGGSPFGRFLDLLGGEALEQLKKFYASEEKLDSQCTFVETSHMPSFCRGANVTMHPNLRTACLDLVEGFQTNALSLDQIYVGANEDRFYLTNQEENRDWVFRTGNALSTQSNPVALRFLKDVSNSRYEQYQNFSWNSLVPFSFLPRIKFKKSILAPAQWLVNKSMLNAKELTKSLKKWMNLWNLPRYLLFGKGDVRTFVDRSCEGHLQEMVNELKKGVTIHLTEKVGQLSSKQWLCSKKGTHFHELVVPFLKNPAVHIASRSFLSSQPTSQSMNIARKKLLGSDWLYIKLYLHQEHQERFILNLLAPFANHWMSQRWFFIRYADPRPHLRVRFRGEQEKLLQTLIPAIHDVSSHWLKDKWISDVQFGTYERELERYGGAELVEMVEEFFFADTETTLDLLMMIAHKKTVLPVYVIAAVSLVDLLKGFGSLSDMQTLDFFTLVSEKEEMKGIREWKQVLGVLTEHVMKDTLTTLNTEEACSLHAALSKRKNALHQLTQAMQSLHKQNLLSCSIELIQSSIIHMHCNRLMGPERHLEHRALLYANSSVKRVFQKERTIYGC